MEESSRIDHFTVGIHLETISIGKFSSIGRSNWITGFPIGTKSRHFIHEKERKPELIIGKHSAITKNHHIDCTNKIIIGDFTTVAGYNSQFLTHSINIYTNRQESNPIIIGDYNFIGTNVTILGGSTLPNYSVLGAKSLLNKKFNDEYALYGGNPAIKIKNLPKDSKYFLRKTGFVL
ncbi:acyltransferase [Flavobacterium sp. LB2P6]|uniref:acyltransferase n=1 Tax=Flavobacterium sp. LB2P6 TaxID=3401714 RepID=UPI003AAE68A4